MAHDAKRLSRRRISRTRKVPSLGYARCLIQSRRSEAETIKVFWRRWGDKLQLDFKTTRLVKKECFTNSLGKQILYQQHYGKQAISRGWFRLDFNPEGDIVSFSNRCLTGNCKYAILNESEHLSARQAITTARSSLEYDLTSPRNRKRPPRLLADPHDGFFRQGNRLLRCWKIVCLDNISRQKFIIYVDASNGRVVCQEALVSFRDGLGRVFIPNPMSATNRPELRLTDAIPDIAYRTVTLNGLESTGYLDGPYVSTSSTTNRKKSLTGDFRDCASGDPGFYEVMAYYHIDRVQRYVRSIVTSDRYPIKVIVNANSNVFGQSAYDYESGVLHLYQQNPRDGEDAEVILHEYGHALHGAIAPGFGQSGYSQPLAEGFADYLAASCLADAKADIFKPGLASWHARGMGDMQLPPFLRRLDFPGPFVANSSRLIETWSACLWEIRRQLGRQRADTLAILSLHLHDPHLNNLETYFAAALAVWQANDQIYKLDNATIENIFRQFQIFT